MSFYKIVLSILFCLGPPLTVLAVPPYMLDHTGFSLPENSPMANGALTPQKFYPAIPLKEKRGLKNKVMGYVIPSKYIDGSNGGYHVSENRISINLGSTPSAEAQLAIAQMRRTGLHTYYVAGNVYGLREPVNQVKMGRESGFGISLIPTFGKKTLDLTDYSSDFTLSPLSMGVDLFDDIDALINGPTTEERIQQSLRESTILNQYIYSNATNDFFEFLPILNPAYSHLKEVKAVYNSQLELPTSLDSLGVHSHAGGIDRHTYYSSELNDLMDELQQKRVLKKEVMWKGVVDFAVQNTLVIADPIANVLVQTVCDVLAEVMEVPEEIWPRCRVAATLVPNAWAFPGGDIFISAGMLGITPSLDSLIYVLGHELGHVVARHASKRAPLAQGYQIGITALNYYFNYIMMKASFSDMGSLDWLNFFPKTMAATAKGVAYSVPAGYALGQVVQATLVPFMAFGRAQETQSDRLGQQVALSLGLENQKFVEGWQAMQSFGRTYFDDGKNPGFWDRLLRSHPHTDKRIKGLENRKTDMLHAMKDKKIGQFASLMFDDYQAIHQWMKPYVESYGAFMQQKIAKRNAGQLSEGDSLQVDHFMESLYNGAFDCHLTD